MFGFLLMLEKLFLLKLLKKLPAAVGHIYAIIIFVLGWVLFYFEDMGEMWIFITRLFGGAGLMPSADVTALVLSYVPLLLIAGVASTPLAVFLYGKIKSRSVLAAFDTAACAASLAVCTAAIVSSAYNPFLYFKF